MAKEVRFIKIYSQGALAPTEILVDTVTGVNYLSHSDGSGCGFTVLLDRDGRPVVSSAGEIEEYKSKK